jgi:ADP-ribosylation factor protein 1
MGSELSSICKRLFGKKQVEIIMAGLDGAGKTTIIYQLKLREKVETIPTIGLNVETIPYKNIDFIVRDIAGRNYAKSLMRHYYPNTHGIVFVVDSRDIEGFDLARELFTHMVQHEDLRNKPFLVLANKQDLLDAISAQEISDRLGLDTLRDRRWTIQETCANTGEGLLEGLEWLSMNFPN